MRIYELIGTTSQSNYKIDDLIKINNDKKSLLIGTRAEYGLLKCLMEEIKLSSYLPATCGNWKSSIT